MKLKPSEQESLEVAAKLFKAIEQGNVAAVRNLYAPQIKIWHNFDGATQTIEENLALLEWMVGNIAEIAYTDIKRQPTPTGFVQQHVLHGTAKSSGKKDCSRGMHRGDRRGRPDHAARRISGLRSNRCAARLASAAIACAARIFESARSSCDD